MGQLQVEGVGDRHRADRAGAARAERLARYPPSPERDPGYGGSMMSAADTFSYFVTLVAIAIAPGPVVLMLMVRAASNDAKGAAGFGFGAGVEGFAPPGGR